MHSWQRIRPNKKFADMRVIAAEIYAGFSTKLSSFRFVLMLTTRDCSGKVVKWIVRDEVVDWSSEIIVPQSLFRVFNESSY